LAGCSRLHRLRGRGAFWLIAAGEDRVTSSLAAILISSMPLVVALLAVWLLPDDRPAGLRLVGLVIGFGGVVALLGVWLSTRGRPREGGAASRQ
jgi:drug/metabolite transporter (DMT)-like permease